MEDEDDDSCLSFDTRFRKCSDEPNVLDWIMGLRRYSGSSDDEGKLLAFLAQPGYLPDADDEWYFDIFDMRSQHAMQAFHLLAGERPLIQKALGQQRRAGTPALNLNIESNRQTLKTLATGRFSCRSSHLVRRE
jgi:hypothetical protein